MTTTSTAPAARTRVRAASPAAKPQPTDEMRNLATRYYLNNKDANECKGVADKARKELYGKMKGAGVEGFTHQIPTSETPINLTIAISAPEGVKIDPLALWALMGAVKDPKAFAKAVDPKIWAQFIGMVSVTKKAIQDELGNAAATRCETPVTGTENVKVDLVKN